MRKSFWIFFAAALVLCVFMLLFKRGQQTVTAQNVPEQTQSTGSQPIQQSPQSPVSGISANASQIHSNSQSVPQNINPRAWMEQVQQRQDRLIALARSPLLFYGKVVDESNRPIGGVQVSYTAHTVSESKEDVFNTGAVTSNDRGIFKIDGTNGIGLILELSHSNYYPYPDNSTGFDKRSLPRKGYFSDSEEKAELFRMHSKGHPVPLVRRADGVNVPLNETPTLLAFRGSDSHTIGQLVIEASGTPPPRYNQQPFDWDVKISVPDGGLIEYTNRFDFIAPDNGYQSSIEFAFPKETNGWTDTISKNYFVKLPSGYARLNIYIGAKNPLFFSIEYDYNPDGSKNLERQ
jgi:hypothetical protein